MTNKKTLFLILLIVVIISSFFFWNLLKNNKSSQTTSTETLKSELEISVSSFCNTCHGKDYDEINEDVTVNDITLPINSDSLACELWDKALPKTNEIPYYPQNDKCSIAEDKGGYWEISSFAPGCTGCNGIIEKETGNIKDIQCFIGNTCNE